MSGSQIGGGIGAVIGFIVGGPAGVRWGFTIGSILGGIVDPEKVYGPRLSDAQRQTSQEGVPIPFGYGNFPCAGNVVWADALVEHEEEQGKGGPKQITYSYTRSYAIGVCEGEAFIQKIKRNGKLVYDISDASTIAGKSAEFAERVTIYTGDETQTVDPTIEAVLGVGNVGPMRGLCYIVVDDDDVTETQGAIPQYEFVVQKCGALVTANPVQWVCAMETGGDGVNGTRDGDWTTYNNNLPGGGTGSFIASYVGVTVVMDSTDKIYRSTDAGVTYTLITSSVGTDRTYRAGIRGYDRFIFISTGTGADVGKSFALHSTDGLSWTETELGFAGAEHIQFAVGRYVITTLSSLGGDGIWSGLSITGSWDLVSIVANFKAIHHNGDLWMAVGGNGKTYTAPDNAQTWTFRSQPLLGVSSFLSLNGRQGYFVAGAGNALGVYRTTDNGDTWTQISGTQTGTATSSAYGRGMLAMGFNTSFRLSDDDGLTFTTNSVAIGPGGCNDIAFIGPDPSAWFEIPDAPDLWADSDGNLITDFVQTQSLSACTVLLSEIVADLCERAGIEASEYDVSELTDSVTGYKCATESSAQAFIDPLTQAYFFDRGEWDKKVRFPKRGRASVAALSLSNLIEGDPSTIQQTRVQEVELLRKVNILTIDPAAGYNVTKQSAERRIGTIQARSESSAEIPLVCDTDTAARIADKRLKVAWAETDKFRFAVSIKHSYLTPTDVITLTDAQSVSHRVRLVDKQEEAGAIEMEEAMKDRAAAYDSTATGVTNPNQPPPVDTVSGPTLFAAMNLPQFRSQDNTPGVHVAAAGVMDSWPGCQVLLSVDGGLTYSLALSITQPSTLGYLTAANTYADSPDRLEVHVYGGTLESKTSAQVASGGNTAAVVSNDIAEVLSFEDATATATRDYSLGTLTRGLLDTTAADHEIDDVFADLATVYFIPIDDSYEGTTLYFKAVTFGLSPDSVDPVTLVFEATDYILDGGGA